ncbi:unnamed protein product [Closterium sp. NIES-53]
MFAQWIQSYRDLPLLINPPLSSSLIPLFLITISSSASLPGPSHQRDHCEPHVRPVDPKLQGPASADQPVGERDAVGDEHAAVCAHSGVPVAGGAHGAHQQGGGRGGGEGGKGAWEVGTERKEGREARSMEGGKEGGKEGGSKFYWGFTCSSAGGSGPQVAQRPLPSLPMLFSSSPSPPPALPSQALRMVEVYRQFAWEQAAVPVIVGRKSPNETFAGADTTYTIEAMAGDRRALQAGTSHFLGQNFAKAFGTKYLAETGEQQFVWQTSWGVSTRMVGAVIMGHGDDMGLKLPPNLAPVQVVIVPIWKAEGEKEAVLEAAGRAEGMLRAAGVRVKLDKTEQRTPGFKFNFWEMKGVPVRIEIGPRDVAANTVVTARRDRPGKQGKQFGVSMDGDGRELVSHVHALLQEVQDGMLADAVAFRDSHIVEVASYDELKAAIASSKWARGPWAGSNEDEQQVKEETGATLRCFPFEPKLSDATCFFTGKPATERAIFSRAY